MSIPENKQFQSGILTDREHSLFQEGPILLIEWAPTNEWPVKMVTPNVSTILGYTPEEMISEGFAYASLIHPDDFEAISSEVVRNIEQQRDNYDQTYRIKSKVGEYRWFYDKTKLLRNDENEIIAIIGYLYDITAQKESEEVLKKERYRLASIIEGTNVGTWEWNVETGETFFDERWANIIGYTLEEISPVSIETWKKFAHPEDFKTSAALLDSHFKGFSDYYEFESRMLHKNGEWIWVLDRGKIASWTKDGKPLLMMGTHQDITEYNRIKVSLAESEKRYRQIFDDSPDAYLVLENSIIIDCNQAAERMLKGERNQIIGQVPNSLSPKYQPDGEISTNSSYNRIAEAIQKGSSTFEWVHRRFNGEEFWAEISIISSAINGKSVLLVTMRDISQRKQMEDQVKASEANFRTLFDAMEDFLMVCAPEGRVLYANRPVYDKLGYSIEELTVLDIFDVHSSGNRQESKVIFDAMIQGKRHSCAFPLQSKTGKSIPVETKVAPGKWNGKDAIYSISKDLSREQEAIQKFDKLFAINPTMMALSRLPDRRYIEVNEAFLKGFSFLREQVIGKTVMELELVVEPEAMQYTTEILKRDKYIRNYEMKLKTGTGLIIDGLFSGEILTIGGERYFLTVVVDITQRKQVEQSLVEQTQLQATLMRIANQFINASLDRSDEIINEALEALGMFTKTDRAYIFSYDHSKSLTHNTYEWCALGVQPQIENLQDIPLEALSEWTAAHFAGQSVLIPNVFELDLEDSVRQVLEPQGIKSLYATPMMEGETCVGFVGFDAVRQHHVFGENERALLTIFALMVANLQRRVKTQFDLTKAMELARAGSQAKSEFLANMSHEIRTPLNSVIGFTDLLAETNLSELQKQYVESANVSGRTLLGIINDILDFSKIEAGMLDLEFIRSDLMLLVSESFDMVRYTAANKELELLIDIDELVPRYAKVDGTRLKQILTNLLSNAVKFTEWGEIELKLGFERLDFEKGKLSFSVRDTGIGITDKQQDKLFKAFSQADSSTTRKFGGTGLGLIISEMIAKKMGSQIRLKSVEGKGTTFFFELVTETYEGEGEELPIKEIQTIQRCLIIDDNKKNRSIMERLLNGWGIACESCDNGVSGLELLKSSIHYDVIFCDYHMPTMNGAQVIQRITEYLAQKKETLPIVLMQLGTESDELNKNTVSSGQIFNLIKPIVKESLFTCLHQLLNTSTRVMQESDNEILILPESVMIANVKRIVIADDVKMNVRLLKAVLEKNIPSAEILSAVDGKQVIELFKTCRVDLIFMDVQMPVMDGIEATHIIRKLERESGGRVPIIALTAGVLKEEREKCLTAGMDGFVGKPFEVTKIKVLLEQYLK